jgi:hypothetical protein
LRERGPEARSAARSQRGAMELHHPEGECPGQWVRTTTPPVTEWRCTHCGAAYSGDDISARESIWREYELELLFFRLGAEGRLLLGAERSARRVDGGLG